MARPYKPGLEYFPKDSNMYGERKIRRLMATWGLKGIIVYEYLLCLIYGDRGYYIKYDSELAFDVSDFLKNGVTEEDVRGIITTCVEINLFDFYCMQHVQILTSSGIQQRYLKAKRGGIIDERFEVIAVKTRVIAAETTANSALSTQSKVKESKVNKSIVNESKREADSPIGGTQNSSLRSGVITTQKPEEKKAPPVAPPPPDQVKKFDLVKDELGITRCMVLREMLVEYRNKNPTLYPESMYKKFLVHWSTPTANGKPKWRNELDKKNGAFDIPGRLATWKGNEFNSANQRGGSQKLRPTAKGVSEYRGGAVLNDVED
ncbi:DUF4373 domain-containing protein [Dyadobacter sp. Leaf189]|uniref:DUF4373 domain-containing protein n=1 Tax=Dyadobacter sp. Leaf189 TaxID=1736295 RepID=UPI0006F229AB|nr:DUF4373 domain-containing protein [Dyadobacter sp. Leaf189]KQS34003.1 hypothetical protein ASG33_08205 [Dyadobacter sp. Leaf189]